MYNISNMSSELKDFCDVGKLFDLYRLVDPETHSVYDCNSFTDTLRKAPERCYDIWNRGLPCKNCISKHTCVEQKEHMKVEYVDGKIITVFSLPIKIGERKLSLELAKDTTESMVAASKYTKDNTEITEVIREFNEYAIRDAFTGLYNKTYISNEVGNMIEELSYVDYLMSGVMLDIDNFKSINDTYGHSEGDKVLKDVARCIKQAANENGGWAGRYGGDEFVMFFKERNVPQVTEICDRLLNTVKNCGYTSAGEYFDVKFSYGVQGYVRGDSAKQFLEKMDRSMYDVKKHRV